MAIMPAAKTSTSTATQLSDSTARRQDGGGSRGFMRLNTQFRAESGQRMLSSNQHTSLSEKDTSTRPGEPSFGITHSVP